MKLLTDSSIEIMRHLSRYLYLTNAQLRLLKISSNRQVIQRKTRHLTTIRTHEHPYVQVMKYPPIAKVGRFSHVYSLTQRGGQKLDTLFPEEAPFAFVKRASPVSRDYQHRQTTITAHIRITQLLQKYPALELAFFHRYFEKTGSNHSKSKSAPLHAKTRVELEGENRFIIPDVILLIQQRKGSSKKMVCCLEISNGKDAKRILASIGRHTEVLASQAVGKKYGLIISHRVMYLMTEVGLLKAVLERFFEIPHIRSFIPLFSFALFDDFMIDPENCWQRADEPERCYSFLTGKLTRK